MFLNIHEGYSPQCYGFVYTKVAQWHSSKALDLRSIGCGFTLVLRELHWLLIGECVNFKVACLVRQSMSGQAPVYVADYLLLPRV